MGGLSSPDIAVAPPPAELAPTGPQAPAPDAGSSPEDAAAAGISPDAVPPSTDAAAATAPETPQPAVPTAEEQTKQQVVALAKALAEEMQAAKAKETAAASKPYLETVIDLSHSELEAERDLALAIKAGDTELQTQHTEALAAIRAQRKNEMVTRDKRPIEDRINEAHLFRTDAKNQLKQAKTSKDPRAIKEAQARYDDVSRYTHVVESEKKRFSKKGILQLIGALILTAVGQTKEQAAGGFKDTQPTR